MRKQLIYCDMVKFTLPEQLVLQALVFHADSRLHNLIYKPKKQRHESAEKHAFGGHSICFISVHVC